jgi:hypothetical protein
MTEVRGGRGERCGVKEEEQGAKALLSVKESSNHFIPFLGSPYSILVQGRFPVDRP